MFMFVAYNRFHFMARLKLQMPSSYLYQFNIKVRIDDLNYGNHLSNDTYMKYMHEARIQFLNQLGLSEMNIGGCSIIMGEAAIQFQQECFYGEELTIEITAATFGTKSFDFFYRFTKSADQSAVCEARTGMVCFDYTTKKSMPIPESFKQMIYRMEA
jgi:acyl-CoA thioester hydrolase